MCFLCPKVNKDDNTPQAKIIFHKEIRRNGSIIQEAISTIPKTTFCDPVNMVMRPCNVNAQVVLQITNYPDTLRHNCSNLLVKTLINIPGNGNG